MVVTTCIAPYVRWILNSEKKAVCTISDTIHGALRNLHRAGNQEFWNYFRRPTIRSCSRTWHFSIRRSDLDLSVVRRLLLLRSTQRICRHGKPWRERWMLTCSVCGKEFRRGSIPENLSLANRIYLPSLNSFPSASPLTVVTVEKQPLMNATI
jgi:hypothetical protein